MARVVTGGAHQLPALERNHAAQCRRGRPGCATRGRRAHAGCPRRRKRGLTLRRQSRPERRGDGLVQRAHERNKPSGARAKGRRVGGPSPIRATSRCAAAQAARNEPAGTGGASAGLGPARPFRGFPPGGQGRSQSVRGWRGYGPAWSWRQSLDRSAPRAQGRRCNDRDRHAPQPPGPR